MMASTRIRDCPVLFNDDVLGVPKGKKSATSPRKRKSAMKDFQTQEEYKRFAKSRNAATKRCRQKKEEELKILREENPALREENARLRHKSEEALAENAALKGRLAEMERELEEALARLKLGGSCSPGSPGGAASTKTVTLALRSDSVEGNKEPDLLQQAMPDLFDAQFDDLVFGTNNDQQDEEDNKIVEEFDISIIPEVPYEPELDPFQPVQDAANIMWS